MLNLQINDVVVFLSLQHQPLLEIDSVDAKSGFFFVANTFGDRGLSPKRLSRIVRHKKFLCQMFSTFGDKTIGPTIFNQPNCFDWSGPLLLATISVVTK